MMLGNRRIGKILKKQVNNFACALLAKGFDARRKRGDFAGNVPEWTIVDIAAIAAGGIGVGIYPTSSPEQCEYIINHSDAEFVFIDSAKQMEKISQIRMFPKVKEIIYLKEVSGGFAASMCGKAVPFREALQPGVEAELNGIL